MNEIEVDLSQEKTNFINDAYQKELQYWKKVALKRHQLRMKQRNEQIWHP